MHPEISILLANFNNGHFFKEAFDSLLHQTFKNWEAIVIDDCSTDNSVEVIQNLIKGDHRFLFFKNEVNKGYQQTIVRAVSLSRAEIFGRLDPDDTLSPDAIELSMNAHRKNPEAGLVYSDLAVRGKEMEFWWKHSSKQIDHLDETYYNLNGEISPFATFKKSVYNRTSGLDPWIRRAEDKDIYMKMCEAAPVVYIPRMLYNYRQVEGSLSTNSNELKAIFWHWVALTRMMDRRKINLEDIFVDKFVDRQRVNDSVREREQEIKWLKNNWFGRLLGKTWGKNF